MDDAVRKRPFGNEFMRMFFKGVCKSELIVVSSADEDELIEFEGDGSSGFITTFYLS